MNKVDFRLTRIPVEVKKCNASSATHGISCKLKSENNFTSLEAELPGPEGTPYEGGIFKLSIEFAAHYPFQPPVFKFITPVFHPNIDTSGNICLDLLHVPPKGSYVPALTLETILLSIQLLLSSPNTNDPLNDKAAQLYIYNREKFNEDAIQLTKKYAFVQDPSEIEPK